MSNSEVLIWMLRTTFEGLEAIYFWMKRQLLELLSITVLFLIFLLIGSIVIAAYFFASLGIL